MSDPPPRLLAHSAAAGLLAGQSGGSARVPHCYDDAGVLGFEGMQMWSR